MSCAVVIFSLGSSPLISPLLSFDDVLVPVVVVTVVGGNVIVGLQGLSVARLTVFCKNIPDVCKRILTFARRQTNVRVCFQKILTWA